MIKTLYDDKDSMLSWLQHAPGSWVQHLREEQKEFSKKLKEETDILKIGRLQGKLEVIDRLVGLKEELNGVMANKK